MYWKQFDRVIHPDNTDGERNRSYYKKGATTIKKPDFVDRAIKRSSNKGLRQKNKRELSAPDMESRAYKRMGPETHAAIEIHMTAWADSVRAERAKQRKVGY